MVWSGLQVGTVLAGRGARACDMCGKERASWYCSSDEAYLCERCDSSVHSANTLARRHERMKLGPDGEPSKIKETFGEPKTIKLSSLRDTHSLLLEEENPDSLHKSWCRLQKRCRTARKSSRPSLVDAMQEHLLSRVPSIKGEAEDDNILLYNLVPGNDHLDDFAMPPAVNIKLEPPSPSILRDSILRSEGVDAHHEVPIYEPLLQELVTAGSHGNFMEDLVPSFISLYNDDSSCKIEEECSSRSCEATIASSSVDTNGPSLPSRQLNMDAMVEIATNSAKEGSDIDTFDVMELCSNTDLYESILCSESQKVLPDMVSWRAAYESDQCGSCRSAFKGNPFKGRGERESGMHVLGREGQAENQWKAQPVSSNKLLSLRLDCEEVLLAWSDRGSLWLDGQRPHVVPDIFSLDLMEGGRAEGQEVPFIGGSAGAGREARVVRYRQKRHTRLFRKTIRYEVRKVNAERRPRLKGRFVKRSSLEGI